MWPDKVSNPGPLALGSDALPTALRSPALILVLTLWVDGGLLFKASLA